MLFLEFLNLETENPGKSWQEKISYLFKGRKNWELLRVHKSGEDLKVFIAKGKINGLSIIFNLGYENFIKVDFSALDHKLDYGGIGIEVDRSRGDNFILETKMNYLILKDFIKQVTLVEKKDLLNFIKTYKSWFC